MKYYSHNTSKKLTDMETTVVANGYLDMTDVNILHEKYEESRYRYLTPEEFCESLVVDWYRFDKMFNDDYDADTYRHGFASAFHRQYVIEWYLEMLHTNPTVIEPGTKATVFYYSDSRAVTVVSVEYFANGKNIGGLRIPKKVGVAFNDTKVINFESGDYEVIPFEDLESQTVKRTFTWRKGGRWVQEGQNAHGGLRLGVGFWHHYIDPCF